MNKRTEYLLLKGKHQEELSNFPIVYAFNEQQLEEALEKLGATREECVTVFNHGDIVKRTDARKLLDMMRRHTEEIKEAMNDPDFAEAAFLYEMDNHEYAINWTGDEDVLRCFGLDEDDLVKLGLENAYLRARNQHMKNAREWDMI
ncbi:hypothetical protein [Fibrobacter sp.]|uniref:DUF7659 family protein n=1 Tax=Fibrobacter sp. TaxID=35828 RepID=UPI00388FA8EC